LALISGHGLPPAGFLRGGGNFSGSFGFFDHGFTAPR
jgi:hypothetical protein